MIEPTPEQTAELVSFVRDELGCGCPDEVFSDIRIEQRPDFTDTLALDALIRVGGRLLVGISFRSYWDSNVDQEIEQLLEAGQRLRDRGGFNRFRLVIAVQKSQTAEHSDPLQLSHYENLDDKIHLHVIGTSAVPKFLTQPEA